MRIKYRYLKWDSSSKPFASLLKMLDKYAISYKYKENPKCVIPSFSYKIEFYIYENDPVFDQIGQIISKHDIKPEIGTEYEIQDIKNADWFIVTTGEYQYPLPDGDNGYLNLTFNLDQHCRLCGIGKLQNAPFRLKEPKQLNNQFWGLHWEFDAVFVRPNAKALLEKENIKGIRFSQPVLHKKNIAIKDFYQLHIDTILPKAFNHYNTQIIHCKANNEEGYNTDLKFPYCGRIKFHHPMIGGYCFDKKAFNTANEIVQTYEYFGSGASAYRLQIVSKRLKMLIEKNKLRGLKFTPVIHEEFKR